MKIAATAAVAATTRRLHGMSFMGDQQRMSLHSNDFAISIMGEMDVLVCSNL